MLKNITAKLLFIGATTLGLLMGPAAFAQAITTSSLSGSVTNEAGTPVTDASVQVVHEPTGSAYTATIRADGGFALRGLRPGGPYSINVSAPGYRDHELDGVYLDIDTGAVVSVRMSVEEAVQLEKVTVTSSAIDQLFDTTQTGSGSYVSARDIRDLPMGDRSINSLARLDPRITYNRDPFDRAISVNGMSNRFNSIQIDGVSANDPFGLNANNTAAERNVIPMDSLEAVSISTAPYNVRSAGFVGGQINAITKSGTNEFHGSLSYSYRGRSAFGGVDLVGTELDGIERPLSSFSEETIGATLGGPIIRNRLFFYLSYEGVDEERVAPSPANRLPQATIDQIAAAAQSLGFDVGSDELPSGNKLKDDNILAKIDWNINQDHRASFRYNKAESSRPTFPGMGGSGISENNFSFSSSWYDQKVENTSYIGQLISRWSDRLNTELSLSRSEYHSEPSNNTRQPSVQIRNVPVPGSSNTSFVNFGTEISRHANVLDVATDTAEIFASYELNDKHTLRFGFQYEAADVYNLFVQNALGAYDFNNLEQFLAVAANNNGTLNYRTFTYNQMGEQPAAEFGENNAGFFISDMWRVRDNLTVDVGVRLDMPLLPDAVPYNAAFHNAFGVRNDHTYDGEKILQPRIGFNWQPNFDSKRTIIRGGAGLFYGKAPRVWISNSYSNTGFNFRTYSSGTNPVSGVSASPAPAVSSNPDNQPTAGGAPAQQVNFINPDFQLPSRWKANLAVEREVGFWDLKASVEYEQSWVNKDVFYRNVNITPTRAAGDGRLLYWNSYGATASGTRLVDTAFTNRIIEISNTGAGGTRSFTFALERPRQSDGWYWRAAYVNTHATEVMFGTSSTASSNWNNRSIFNPNSREEHTSELEIRDRVLINASKDFEWVKGYRTTFSVLYEGRSGYPFSLVYTSDANGDSQSQNDLIYVPNRNGDPLVRFATPADQEKFFQIVDRFGLAEGRAVSADSERYPWVNIFDVSVKQEIKLPGWRHRLTLSLDILNVGNLLNDEWGLIRGSNQFFVKREGVARAVYDGVNNQYVYSEVSSALASGADFNPSLGRGEPAASRWSILMRAIYEF